MGTPASARAAETYLRDEKNNILILGVSGAGATKDIGPYKKLWGDGDIQMSYFSINVLFNEDNTFKSVSSNGKTYTIQEWNQQFTALDPKSSSVRTSTNSTGGVDPTGADPKK